MEEKKKRRRIAAHCVMSSDGTTNYRGRASVLEVKLFNGTITPEEMKELSTLRANNKSKGFNQEPKWYLVRLFGKESWVDKYTYKEQYASAGINYREVRY